MKNINKYLSIALAASALASCADLDTQYYGSYVTDEQKESTLKQNPEMATAAVTSILSEFGSYYGQYSASHWDFGYPSIMMGLDGQTADFLAKIPYTSSHIYWFAFIAPNPQGIPTGMMWTHLYKQIKTANSLLTSIPKDGATNADLKFYRAQALAVRAFDYWVLGQCYQFNYAYVNPEEARTVPIITELNQDQVAANGAPRATVAKHYEFLLSDINEAITLLTEANIDPASVMSNKPKRMISLAVALGLRARIYLTMHKYEEAAADAEAAIAAFNGRPYTRAEVSVPSFINSDDASWMWSIVVASTDRPTTTGICNWPSQMGSFNDGYANSSGWRWCNKILYESIPMSDVRKGWFLNENYTSPNLSAAEQAYLDQYIGEGSYAANSSDIMPYTQVKYAAAGGGLGGYTTGYEVPLMRVEEMYLILAEAQGMSGNVPLGLATLKSFVNTYRDPNYNFSTTDAAAFQDEVWRQRRIELWGEGLAFFDVMRLNKDVDRRGGAAMNDYNYYIKAGDPVLIYCIPLNEVNTNPQLGENNQTATRPVPVIQ